MSTVAAQPRPAVDADGDLSAQQVGLPARPSRLATLRAYISLTKPRIVELLLVTTVPAMVLAAGGLPPLGLTVVVLVGGALAAGAANAINCYIDRDIDQVMGRTATRPLPAHTLTPRKVLLFGLVLGTCAVVLLAVFANLLAAALTLAAIVYYDLIYTLWLKRTTPHNTVLGGVSGAAPVLIGWAAVTGSLGLTPWLLFAIVFLWQPPHFYALALRYRDDYARAGIPMLSVVSSSRRVTGESVVYVWLTAAASLALWAQAMGLFYGVTAVVLAAPFILQAHRLHSRSRGEGQLHPMRLFHWSNAYLALLFAAVAVDAILTN